MAWRASSASMAGRSVEHRSGLPSPAELADRMACPVLALWGGADRASVRRWWPNSRARCRRAGVEHRSITYPDAPHSFFDRTAAEYANESEDAWRQMLDFMRHRPLRRPRLPPRATGPPAGSP